MKENPVQIKSYDFALRTIKLYRFLSEKKKEFILSKQVLRSGTSIGANVEEAIGGLSKKDIISKMSIAYKEARNHTIGFAYLEILNLFLINKPYHFWEILMNC